MRFIIAQGYGQRIFQFQGDGGGVSGADAASGALGGGVRVAHGDGQHRVAALGVRRTQGALRGAVRGRRDERREPRPVRSSADAPARSLADWEAAAIQIALNGTAATMIKQKKGGEQLR